MRTTWIETIAEDRITARTPAITTNAPGRHDRRYQNDQFVHVSMPASNGAAAPEVDPHDDDDGGAQANAVAAALELDANASSSMFGGPTATYAASDSGAAAGGSLQSGGSNRTSKWLSLRTTKSSSANWASAGFPTRTLKCSKLKQKMAKWSPKSDGTTWKSWTSKRAGRSWVEREREREREKRKKEKRGRDRHALLLLQSQVLHGMCCVSAIS